MTVTPIAMGPRNARNPPSADGLGLKRVDLPSISDPAPHGPANSEPQAAVLGAPRRRKDQPKNTPARNSCRGDRQLGIRVRSRLAAATTARRLQHPAIW